MVGLISIIHRQLRAGELPKDIARALDVSMATVYRTKYAMGFNDATAERLQEHQSRGGVSTAGRTAIAKIPVPVAGFVAPASASAPAPCPVIPAPPRPFYVLDWQQRMSVYAYTPAPEGCIPRKSKLAKSRRGLTHQQLNEAFYVSPANAEINAKPQAQQ